MPRARSALAGAVAATVWGLLEPLDMRLFRHDYSDIALLGKTFTRGPWRAVGFAAHAVNGAAAGVGFYELRLRTRMSTRRLAITAAMVEHVAFFPLGALVDRYHPAHGQPGVARLFCARAFAQETLRHLVFGVVLAVLGGLGETTSEPPGRAARPEAASSVAPV
jgi:hypothetical protein